MKPTFCKTIADETKESTTETPLTSIATGMEKYTRNNVETQNILAQSTGQQDTPRPRTHQQLFAHSHVQNNHPP